MLLRRVIEHVRDQNWTAIGIDFCIVVIGVFVGIQVANWNAARADERRGQAYAARLAEDLGKDLASRRALVAYYAAVLEAVERTDGLLADPASDPEELVVAAYRATEINYMPTSVATWNEIVSSGAVGLLPRDATWRVAEFFAFDNARDSYGYLGASDYRRTVRSLVPLAVQKAIRAGCSDVRDAAQLITGFMPGCVLDVAPDAIAATAAALRADPAVATTLRMQYSTVVSTHINIDGDVVAIEAALAALDAGR